MGSGSKLLGSLESESTPGDFKKLKKVWISICQQRGLGIFNHELLISHCILETGNQVSLPRDILIKVTLKKYFF